MNLSELYKQKVFDIQDSKANLKSFLEVERIILLDNPVAAIDRARSEVIRKYGSGSVKILYKQNFSQSFDPTKNKLVAQYIISLVRKMPINQITLAAHNFGENCYIKVNRLQIFNEELKNVPTFKRGQMIAGSTSLSSNQYSRSIRWIFPSRDISQIIIELEQDYCYPVRYSLAAFSPYCGTEELGNLGITLLDISSKKLFGDIIGSIGATSLVDVEAINTSLDLSVAHLAEYYSSTDLYNPVCPGMENWKPGDPITLCKPVPITGVHLNRDVGKDGIIDIPREESNRYRYAIGISDMNFGIQEYKSTSIFVSKQYKIKTLAEISLAVNDFVPSEFGSGEWLKYYVSLDNGATFLRINPTNYNDKKFLDGFVIPKIIYCNSEIPAEFRAKTPTGVYAYYDSPSEIKNVRVKTEMSRPSGNEFKNFTPIVYSFSLNIKPSR